MSRHLLIRCDRAGCPEQIETRASDIETTSIEVPGDWLTLHESGLPDRHYCSMLCLVQAHRALDTSPEPSSQPLPADPYAAPASVQQSTTGPKRSTHKKPQ